MDSFKQRKAFSRLVGEEKSWVLRVVGARLSVWLGLKTTAFSDLPCTLSSSGLLESFLLGKVAPSRQQRRSLQLTVDWPKLSTLLDCPKTEDTMHFYRLSKNYP